MHLSSWTRRRHFVQRSQRGVVTMCGQADARPTQVEVTADDESSPRQRALALVDAEPSCGSPGVAEVLQRLCRAMTHDLGLAGATVTLIPDVGSHSVLAASSPAIGRTEEMQFESGEGPTRVAYHGGQPVVIANLESAMARWPGFAPAAMASGVSSLIAMPLQVGASKLGALSVYGERPLEPTRAVLRTALVYAELATELLIDSSYSDPSTGLHAGFHSALETHGHIYQAQGMTMVDLGIGLPEALARMRAHAYATEQDLGSVANQIIAGDPVLAKDPA